MFKYFGNDKRHLTIDDMKISFTIYESATYFNLIKKYSHHIQNSQSTNRTILFPGT